MIRIPITAQVLRAIAATMPGYTNLSPGEGERFIWLERSAANKLKYSSGAGKSFCEVVRLAEVPQ
jgi:hypothetical protein